MKKVLLLAMGLCGVVSFAQAQQDGRVGVNTTEPKATMDINAISTDDAKGIMVPRLTNELVKTITPKLTADQNSMLAFFTQTFPVVDRKDSYILVAEPGYYYWNQTDKRWERLIVDLRMVGTNNHITQDAGVGGTGTSAGTGSHNVAIGQGTLNAITTGTHNFAIGENALSKATTATHNIAIGLAANRDLEEGSGNIAIGQNVLRVSKGSPNIAIGSHAMLLNTTGNNNTAIGSNALRTSTTGKNNVALGMNAMYGGTNTGDNNVAIGTSALAGNTSGSRNFALGASSLEANTEGKNNIAIGTTVLQKNTTGSNNVVLVDNGLPKNDTGSSNIALGKYPMQENTSGGNNIAIGENALTRQSTQNYNIGIGYNAGNDNFAGNAGGSGLIFIGNSKYDALDSKANNVVTIGNSISIPDSSTSSDRIIIGNDQTTGTNGGVNVGIGVYEPKAKLDVNGGIKVGNAPGACNDETRGVIRYNGGNFEGCTASGWVQLNNP